MKLLKSFPAARKAAAGLGALMLFGSFAAAASTVQMATFAGNDCGGPTAVFTLMDSGFNECVVFYDPLNYDEDDSGSYVVLSPVIAKFEAGEDDLKLDEIATLWPSVDGDEWSFSIDDSVEEVKAGSWTYTPGENDPGIRFWTTKSGNDSDSVTLYWEVDDSEVNEGGACYDVSPFTLACLQAAQSITSGEWDLDQGLSHLTFFDSEDPSVIPIPATIWLFGSAILGLIAVGRKRCERV